MACLVMHRVLIYLPNSMFCCYGTSAKEVIFLPVLVCLSSINNTQKITGFDEIFKKVSQRYKEQLIKLWR